MNDNYTSNNPQTFIKQITQCLVTEKPAYPFITEMLPERPMYFAHDTIHRDMKPRVRPTATIFSWIFSQTRGTPKNVVGRTSFIVSPSEPCVDKCCHNLTGDIPRRPQTMTNMTMMATAMKT